MKPLLSVCIPTYNHAKYIEKSIEGVLSQKVNFSIEILIGEDGSTDGTREICLSYKEKYPDKITLLLNDRKNVIYIDGHPTGRWNFINLLKNAKGKYIALCEGDDYWTDTNKLQKQIDFLETRPDFAFCYHHVEVIQESNFINQKLKMKMEQPDVSSIEQILRKSIWPHLNSIVLRNIEPLKNMPPWFNNCHSGDWAFLALITGQNKIKYIPETMSVYRQHGDGMWSKNNRLKKALYTIQTAKIINSNFATKKQKQYTYWPMHNAYEEIIEFNKTQNIVKFLYYLILARMLDLKYKLMEE